MRFCPNIMARTSRVLCTSRWKSDRWSWMGVSCCRKNPGEHIKLSDLHTGNVLIDKDTGNLAALIDWQVCRFSGTMSDVNRQNFFLRFVMFGTPWRTTICWIAGREIIFGDEVGRDSWKLTKQRKVITSVHFQCAHIGVGVEDLHRIAISAMTAEDRWEERNWIGGALSPNSAEFLSLFPLIFFK